MSRKQFILSHGASCKNWNWSWSFVNHGDRCVIFGAWDEYQEKGKDLIFSETWEYALNGRKANGYPQSREHIHLIEEEGYRLFTFPMFYSDEFRQGGKTGPAKMCGFRPELTEKRLLRIDNDWYAEMT